MKYSSASIHLRSDFDKCIFADCVSRLFPSVGRTRQQTTLRIFQRVADAASDIQTLNSEGILELTVPYLEAMERSLPEVAFRYAVMYKGGKPVVFGCFQLYTVTSANFHLDGKQGIVRSIIKLFIDLKKLKVVFLGNALRNGTSCFCYDRAEINQEKALSLLASMAEQIADEECALGLILKDIPHSQEATDWLTTQKYRQPWSDSIMMLELRREWTSLDYYLTDLTRKYKTRATKILDALGGIELRELDLTQVKKYEQDIDHLFADVLDHQQFRLTKPGKGHFTDLKKNYGDTFEVTGMFDGDIMVGFFSAFTAGDTYEMYYVGFDYEQNTQHQLYFNILFAGLDKAIQQKKKFLNLGRTSFDAKASMGAHAVSQDYFFKAPGVPDRVVDWFANYFSALEDGKWKLRNPLKQQDTVLHS